MVLFLLFDVLFLSVRLVHENLPLYWEFYLIILLVVSFFYLFAVCSIIWDFPGGSVVKNLSAK